MLMHDNARPHTARVVSDFLQTADIETMAWPACSPDLNPIEHVWDALGRRVRARNLNTLQDLRRDLTEEWEGTIASRNHYQFIKWNGSPNGGSNTSQRWQHKILIFNFQFVQKILFVFVCY